MIRLHKRFVPTATLVAAALGAVVKSSDTRNHGIDPVNKNPLNPKIHIITERRNLFIIQAIFILFSIFPKLFVKVYLPGPVAKKIMQPMRQMVLPMANGFIPPSGRASSAGGSVAFCKQMSNIRQTYKKYIFFHSQVHCSTYGLQHENSEKGHEDKHAAVSV